jgi:hypothetical protein
MALSYLGACGVSLPVPGAGILVSAPEGKDATALATAQLFERELFPHEGVHRVTPRSARAELK